MTTFACESKSYFFYFWIKKMGLKVQKAHFFLKKFFVNFKLWNFEFSGPKKHFWNLTSTRENFTFQKKNTFSLKNWILYFFSSGNSKKINLAPSKFSCGGNTPARYFPLYFRWELFLVKKNFFFKARFEFFTCPNIV